jgi:hypothetical protein
MAISYRTYRRRLMGSLSYYRKNVDSDFLEVEDARKRVAKLQWPLGASFVYPGQSKVNKTPAKFVFNIKELCLIIIRQQLYFPCCGGHHV